MPTSKIVHHEGRAAVVPVVQAVARPSNDRPTTDEETDDLLMEICQNHEDLGLCDETGKIYFIIMTHHIEIFVGISINIGFFFVRYALKENSAAQI